MDQVSFCPYRTSVNWANVQTTQFTQPVTFEGKVQVTQYSAPSIFTGTPSDAELLEAWKDKVDPKSMYSRPQSICELIGLYRYSCRG